MNDHQMALARLGVPAGGDLCVLSQVLHYRDDERVRIIVGNCHRVSRPGGPRDDRVRAA